MYASIIPSVVTFRQKSEMHECPCGQKLTAIVVCTAFCKQHEPQHGKTNKMNRKPSEDSDQTGHPPSQISLHCALNG